MKVKVVANISGDKKVPLIMNVLTLEDACSFVDYFAMYCDDFDVKIYVSPEGE